MIWIISLALIAFVFILLDDDPFFAFIAGAFGAILGMLVALMVGAFIYNDSKPGQTDPVYLESLVDGSDLRGHFFLGSGTIDEVAVYTWYEKTGANSFEQRQTEADGATIHYLPKGSGERPHYVVKGKFYEDKAGIKFWGIQTDDGLDDYTGRYHFYVPRGTITNHYELDAK
jgi:hypothetical protein